MSKELTEQKLINYAKLNDDIVGILSNIDNKYIIVVKDITQDNIKNHIDYCFNIPLGFYDFFVYDEEEASYFRDEYMNVLYSI